MADVNETLHALTVLATLRTTWIIFGPHSKLGHAFGFMLQERKVIFSHIEDAARQTVVHSNQINRFHLTW